MNNKRYAQLDNISAVYDAKTNSVSLIGKRGNFENGFKIRLKKGSVEDIQIRKTLFETEAIKLDFTKDNFYPENLPPRINQIPLGINQDNQEVSWDFIKDPSHLLITGKAASGKTFLLKHIKELLEEYYGNNTYYFDEGLLGLNRDLKNVQPVLENIAETLKLRDNHNTPTFLLIDEADYLYRYNDNVKNTIEWLINTGRSYNLHVILAVHNTLELKNISNHCQEISMDTIASQFDNIYGSYNSVRRYGMSLNKEKTELFVPYLPKNLNKR